MSAAWTSPPQGSPLSSPDPTPRDAAPDRVAQLLLGVGAIAVLVALSFLATSIGGSSGSISTSNDAGEGGGDGTLGGRPVTSALAGVSGRFTLAVSESGDPGPPLVVVSVEEEQICSVLRGDGAASWADSQVEWSMVGTRLDDGDTPVNVSTSGSYISSCYRPSQSLGIGVHSVRWISGDRELVDAVVVSDAAATGLVEIHNVTGAEVCAMRISPVEIATSSNDLAGILGHGRRTRLELAIGPARFEADSCNGELVGSGQIIVGSQLSVVVLGDQVVLDQDETDPIEPGDDQSDLSTAVELDAAPFAFGSVWASLVSDVGVAQDRLVFVGPENESNFCLTWEYRNVPAGSAFELVWSVDGVTGPGDVSSGVTSPPADGNFWGCYGNPNGLPDGLYEAEWRIDGVRVFSESIIVGPAQAAELRLRNDSGTAICGVLAGLPGSSSLGLDRLDENLAPGQAVTVPVATGSVDVQVEACNGSRLLDVAGLVVGPEGSDLVIEASPFAFGSVWASLVSDVGVAQDRLVFVGPENESNFCLTWEYRNVPAGSAFELVWSVDGVTGPGDVSSGVTSPPADGNFWGCYGNPNGLPDGLYEAEWRIDGVRVFSESIIVGPAQTTFLDLVNESSAPVCSAYLSVAGSTSSGLNELTEELAVGDSIRLDATVGPHDLRIELCDGRFVWASAEAMIPPEGGAVLVTA